MAYKVYIIENDSGDTYVGMTNNFGRRRRQHNGEIKGGARATLRRVAKGRGRWRPRVIISGLDKTFALQLEWRLQNPRGRPGRKMPITTKMTTRLKHVEDVMKLERPTKSAKKFKSVRMRVKHFSKK